MRKLLIINPGSTSTKIGVFEDEKEILDETLRHSSEEIGKYDTVVDQKDFRKEVILDVLKSKGIDIKGFDAIVGRGGLLKPIEGGTYAVNEEMLDDIKKAERGEHASNLGAMIADEIAKEISTVFGQNITAKLIGEELILEGVEISKKEEIATYIKKHFDLNVTYED